MEITTIFEVRLKTEELSAGYHEIEIAVKDTLARRGNLGVDVLIDQHDPTHVSLVEHWDSPASEGDYQTWRAGDGAPTTLMAMLAEQPIATQYRRLTAD